jgi:hypothetical protein
MRPVKWPDFFVDDAFNNADEPGGAQLIWFMCSIYLYDKA